MSLRERHEQIIDKCVESLKAWKQLITDHLDGDDRKAELDKLKEVTKEHCSIESDFQRSMNAIQKVEDELDDQENTRKDVDKLYKDKLEEEPEPSQDDYRNNEIWQRVLRGISDVMEVKQKESRIDESQFEELGDSLLCSNVFTPPIDPISKVVIRDPYKNKKCKHVYEYSTIVSYIKQLKRKAKCPYIGCKNNQLLMADLVQDAELQTQITQYEAQRGEETEEDDD